MKQRSKSETQLELQFEGRARIARVSRIFAGLLSLILLWAGPISPGASAQTDGQDVVAQKGGKKHKKRAKRPITLGRSGGNINDLEFDPPFIQCGTGTLGALLEKNDELYIVSNNHVLAMINKGKRGDAIVQPGLGDNQCNPESEDVIANLAGFKRIRKKGSNKADVALGLIQDGMVDESGRILRIGIPGNELVAAELGMRVKKAGRTTGITKGFVVATDVTMLVGFGEDEDPIRFKEQIIIEGDGGAFSAGGDSGSLVFEDVKTCPRAVGLLFAGGDGFTAANRMNTVLKLAGKMRPKGEATLVGCTPTETTSAVSQGAFSSRLIASPDSENLELARRVQRRHENALLSLRGVVGVGVGAGRIEPNRAVLKVLVDTPSATDLDRIPAQLDGTPIEVVVTGRFRAF